MVSSDHQGVVVGEAVVQKVVLVVEAFQAFQAFPGNQEVASFHVAAYLQVPRKKKRFTSLQPCYMYRYRINILTKFNVK